MCEVGTPQEKLGDAGMGAGKPDAEVPAAEIPNSERDGSGSSKVEQEIAATLEAELPSAEQESAGTAAAETPVAEQEIPRDIDSLGAEEDVGELGFHALAGETEVSLFSEADVAPEPFLAAEKVDDRELERVEEDTVTSVAVENADAEQGNAHGPSFDALIALEERPHLAAVVVKPVSEIVEEETMEKISLGEHTAPGSSKGPHGESTPMLAERGEDEEDLSALPAKVNASTAEKPSGISEKEGVEEKAPGAPERNGVILLTRQMSRVSSGMGPMSPKFEIREAKELQELQGKVEFLEEELKAKTVEVENMYQSFHDKENKMLNKIECLQLANDQLLDGGHDSSAQLQMELTRLQRQNSVLSVRERELRFQISTQEMLNAQMLEKRPNAAETTSGPGKALETKIASLESKLAEATEVSNMYKIQLHEALAKQKNVEAASLFNLGDGEDVISELQQLRKQAKGQEAELQDLQDRFFLVSVRLAESVASREELLMKIKRIQYQKH